MLAYGMEMLGKHLGFFRTRNRLSFVGDINDHMRSSFQVPHDLNHLNTNRWPRRPHYYLQLKIQFF